MCKMKIFSVKVGLLLGCLMIKLVIEVCIYLGVI